MFTRKSPLLNSSLTGLLLKSVLNSYPAFLTSDESASCLTGSESASSYRSSLRPDSICILPPMSRPCPLCQFYRITVSNFPSVCESFSCVPSAKNYHRSYQSKEEDGGGCPRTGYSTVGHRGCRPVPGENLLCQRLQYCTQSSGMDRWISIL